MRKSLWVIPGVPSFLDVMPVRSTSGLCAVLGRFLHARVWFGISEVPSWSRRGARVLAAGVVSTIAPIGALFIDIREAHRIK